MPRRARAGQDNAMVLKETKSNEELSAGVERMYCRWRMVCIPAMGTYESPANILSDLLIQVPLSWSYAYPFHSRARLIPRELEGGEVIHRQLLPVNMWFYACLLR